ncbi:hypothetical protein [Streptomyces scabichelini]|uniref:hypothetical protein n=1 Tax=Streptomyces scabichelini TaxID=2711217 RepID=UPI0030B9F772
MTAVTVVVGCGIVTVVTYDGNWHSLLSAGAVVVSLLLVLAALVLTLLHTAHAVAVSHALSNRESLGVRELWQRTRPHLPAAFGVQVLTGLCVGGVAFLGFVLWSLADGRMIPGVEPTPLHGTASMQYRLVGWVLPFAIAGLGLLLGFRLSLATAAAVTEKASPRAALRRSWSLTRGSRGKTYGICLLVTVAVALVFTLLRYAATPLAHPAGLAMLWISGDNVYITGVLVLITPTAVALLLLPLVAMPTVCSVIAALHADLRAGLRPTAWARSNSATRQTS